MNLLTSYVDGPLLRAVVGVIVEVVLACHDGEVGGDEAEAAV